MNDTVQCQAENHPAREDWEDDGGFDDDDSLMGFTPCRTSKGLPQERPRHYEQKKSEPSGIMLTQLSFLKV